MDKKQAEIIALTFSAILMVVGFLLTLLWFGWKLWVILFILLWSNNISQRNR